MQSRAGSSGLLSEENGLITGRPVPQPARPAVKREWPLGKFSNLFFFFVLLGSGVLLGVVVSLHVMGYFRGIDFSERCSSSSNPFNHIRPSNPSQDWLSPGGLRHDLTDEELLWRASVVPTRAGMPIQRTPKIAFMFLTKGPMPLAPLWERYFKGYRNFFSIYVHAMPGFILEVPSSSVFYGRQIPSKDTHWGEISMIDAERRLLANALLDFSNERFILLSESCIPVFNFTVFYNSIINSDMSFVGSFDDPGQFGRGRWTPGMLPEVEIENWRKGAQWFEVRRNLAIAIVSDTKYYGKFRDFCVPNCYVDEHYIPTMLSMEFGGELSSTSITAVDWSRAGSHPAMFNANDINDLLIMRIRDDRKCILNGEPNQICFFFARKFSPNTLKPLLALASRVMEIN